MIEKAQFGEISVGDFDKFVYKYTIKNGNMVLEVINYGATVVSIKVPDKAGHLGDVVLGFDTLAGYMGESNPYFGATIGRVCNKISDGRIKIKNRTYYLSANIPPNTYNGGFRGLDKVLWDVVTTGQNGLQMSYTSQRLDEGFPGYVQFKVFYELTDEQEVRIKFTARTTEPTPINLTNDCYFNLAGHETGASGVYDHLITILASKYTPTNTALIPTGEILTVTDTFLDLTSDKSLGEAIRGTPVGFGFDHNFCVDGSDFRPVAKAHHPPTGRTLLVYSNQPGVQFSTANFLNNVQGKGKQVYEKHSGFLFETQNYPNAVNTPSFPPCLLDPNGEYCHLLVYKFLLE